MPDRPTISAPEPKPFRVWGWLAVVVVGIAALAASIVVHTKPIADGAGERKAEPVVTVTVEPVTLRAIDRSVSCVGTLYGRDEIPLSAKVEGRIVSIRCDIGDRVKPGQLLAEIDPTDFRLAIAEAQRALDSELAKLGLKEIPAGALEVDKLPAVERAASQQRNAAARRDRMRAMTARAVSQEERDAIETEYAVAEATVRIAKLDAEATLAVARLRQASLDTAQQKLADTRVVAPSGAAEYAVCHRGGTKGEIVRIMPGMANTLFKLIVDDPLKLVATVPERHRAEVATEQVVELETDAYPGQRFRGTVSRINPSIDRASRTFQIEVAVPNADRKLSPGSFCKAVVHTRAGGEARTVPEEAVSSFAGVTKLFVIDGNRAKAVPVRLLSPLQPREAKARRPWVEIDGDVPAGATVATSGLAQLSDGTLVEVRAEKGEPK